MTLVDSNVLIDIWSQDADWFDWSSQRYSECMLAGEVGINVVIYAEIGLGFGSESELDQAVSAAGLKRLELPFAAAFGAGRAYREYRRSGGLRTSALPDFFIGAHAQVAGLTLLTRDPSGYRSYFPDIALICP